MFKKILVFALAMCMCLSLLACDGDTNPTEPSTTNTPTDGVNTSDPRYATEGKVVVATNAGRTTDTYTLLENFNEYYPNIELEFVYYETTTTEYLAAQAATGNLPDVVMDDADEVYYYVSQGWV